MLKHGIRFRSRVRKNAGGSAHPHSCECGYPIANRSSASSTLNLRVEPLQFCPGVVDFELPVHPALFGIRFGRPDLDLSLQQWQLTDAAVAQALARQAT